MNYISLLGRSSLVLLFLLLIPLSSATTLWETGFESGSINGNLSTYTMGTYAVVRVRGTSDCGDGNNNCGFTYGGLKQLEMGCTRDRSCSGWVNNQIFWNNADVTLYDQDDVSLKFYYKDHGDENHYCPRDTHTLSSVNCDGFWVRCSYNDGSHITRWYLIENLHTSTSGFWFAKNYNLSYWAPTICRAVNYKPYQWAITQYDNYAVASETNYDGFTVDDMEITTAEPPEDFLIDGCQDIDDSGYYNLTQNIETDTTPCWNILVDNVIMDGKNYEVNADAGLVKPEAINMGLNIANFTVKNMTLSLGVFPISQPIYRFVYGKFNDDIYLYNNTLDSNAYFVYLISPEDLTVIDNEVHYTSSGVVTSTATGWVNVNNNNFYGVNRYDYPIYLSSSPKYNITNNYFDDGKGSILATGVNNHNSQIAYNTFNDFEGFYFSAVNYANVFNNTWQGDIGYSNYSVYAYTSGSNNEYYNNYFSADTRFRFTGQTGHYIFNNNWSSGYVVTDTNKNFWNTTLNCSEDPNIINGSCMGGNYYYFNSNCTDADRNGICDDYYNHSTENIDYLPLIPVSIYLDDWSFTFLLIVMGVLTFWFMRKKDE